MGQDLLYCVAPDGRFLSVLAWQACVFSVAQLNMLKSSLLSTVLFIVSLFGGMSW